MSCSIFQIKFLLWFSNYITIIARSHSHQIILRVHPSTGSSWHKIWTLKISSSKIPLWSDMVNFFFFQFCNHGIDQHTLWTISRMAISINSIKIKTSNNIVSSVSGRTLNGQPLLDFPLSSSDPAVEARSIKKATLWARVEIKHPHHYHHQQNFKSKHNITLFVFKVRCGNATHLRGKVIFFHCNSTFI